MLSRRESREIVLQTLFYWDFKQEKNYKEIYDYILNNYFIFKEKKKEKFLLKIKKDSFSLNLVKNIIKKKKEIDIIIIELAPNWPLNKISFLDKNILRIGIFELLFEKKNFLFP